MRLLFTLLLISGLTTINAQNLTQFYGGKVGFYNPKEGLNNGILFGIDGVTEFNNYNFFLSGAADLYIKKSIDIFSTPKPDIEDQQIFIVPLHVNIGYKLLQVDDADTKIYAGIGGGYYVYFYTINHRVTSGGLIQTTSTSSESKNGGEAFFTVFARVLIGKVFIEPRFYLASKSDGNVSNFNYSVDPSGFAIALGFQL